MFRRKRGYLTPDDVRRINDDIASVANIIAANKHFDRLGDRYR